MSYTAIICGLKNVRPHPNGEFIKLAECNGFQVVVGIDTKENELGVFFGEDGQLSIG